MKTMRANQRILRRGVTLEVDFYLSVTAGIFFDFVCHMGSVSTPACPSYLSSSSIQIKVLMELKKNVLVKVRLLNSGSQGRQLQYFPLPPPIKAAFSSRNDFSF